jgi:hypothetical protein
MSTPADPFNELVDRLIDNVSDEALVRLAERLEPHLRTLAVGDAAASSGDGWLTTRAAAEYLGTTVAALHKHTAAQIIPFEQDGPGCKCYFKRADLDEWRRSRVSPRSGPCLR